MRLLMKPSIFILPGRPMHGPPAQQMDMKVEYGLTAVRAGIDHEPVAFLIQLEPFGDLMCGPHQVV